MARRIGARETEAVTLTRQEGFDFLEANSRYPVVGRRISLVTFGLRVKSSGELVAVIQFCSPRTAAMARRYSVELLRLAFKDGVRVPGGASKLIAHYKKKCNPPDIFTYQDMTGEATAVYEHAGFTLVSQAKKKQYLVAPGKTLATGDRRKKEILAMGYATKWGPDRILGTKLGEVLREDGSRKSNKALFIEDLGWHVEETAGDRIYEWFNPNLTFYTYKITATDSDKYYYGVSHVKKANATVEDCIADGYWGSGGVKFQNWKAKHLHSLQKEVLALYSTRAEAYNHEETLVGSAYADDSLCLNSVKGGVRTALNVQQTTLGISVQDCERHGRGHFTGKTCFSCLSEAAVSLQTCEVHGEVKHRGRTCYRCVSERSKSDKICSKHGLSIHKGNSCAKCARESSVSVKLCAIHGEVKHSGNSCYKCANQKTISEKECPIHGTVKHKGDSCYSCMSDGSVAEGQCSVHGETLFRFGVCVRCSAAKPEVKTCAAHGSTLFLGDTCAKCRSEKVVAVKNCEVHGKTKHKGDVCYKCEVEALIEIRDCPIHGLTKFRSGNCCRCGAASSIALKTCAIHGLVKHNGPKCSKCIALKARHTRFHKDSKADDCVHCA